MMRFTDRDFRVGSVLHRARQKGVVTDADVSKLRAGVEAGDPKAIAKAEGIFRRSRKDAVDFDSMTPNEKKMVEWIYFYPWMSRAGAWTARSVAQHPFKSALIAQQGKRGEKAQKRLMGDVPRWMEGYIPTKFGLVNPGSVFTPSTPTQIAQQMTQIIKKQAGLPVSRQVPSALEEFGTPIAELIGGSPAGQVGQGLLPLGLLKRAGVKIPGMKPSVTFPKTGFWPAVGPLLGGGLTPRHPDWAQVKKQYQRQAISEASSVGRVGIRAKWHMKDIPDEVKLIKKNLGIPVPPQMVAGYKGDIDALRARDEFRQSYANKHGGGSYRNLPPRNKVDVALAFLESHSHLPNEQIDSLDRGSHQLKSDAQLELFARQLWKVSGVGQYKTAWDSLVRQAKKRKVTKAK
jgi:hypothetical protein